MALTEMHSTFLRDPLAVFLRAIEHARAPLTFENIRARLVHSGLSEPYVTAQWARFERAVKDDVHITYMPETRTYSWGRAVALPDATEAVQRLASGKAQINPDRQVLGDIVLAALSTLASFQARPKPRPGAREAPAHADTAHAETGRAETAHAETGRAETAHAETGRAETAHAGTVRVETAQAEAERQRIAEERLRAESARAYAKVAAELEELIASGASARTLLQRIHAGAKAYGLRPIETAGTTIRFDRLRHEPVVASTRDGSEVLVIRPGYAWQAGDEEVLVAKAVVIEQ